MPNHLTIQPPRPVTRAKPGEQTRSGRVMIRCAETGEPVPAGTALDAVSFDRMNVTVRCPQCFHEHVWSAEEAWVEELA
jgi:hypothetical protein